MNLFLVFQRFTQISYYQVVSLVNKNILLFTFQPGCLLFQFFAQLHWLEPIVQYTIKMVISRHHWFVLDLVEKDCGLLPLTVYYNCSGRYSIVMGKFPSVPSFGLLLLY
jgi:hypothetical protein